MKKSCRKALYLCLCLCLYLLSQQAAAQQQSAYRLPEKDGPSFGMLPPEFPDTGSIMRKIMKGHRLSEALPDSAIVLLGEALRESKESGFPGGIISALICLGNSYTSKGMYENALLLFGEALSYCITTEANGRHLSVLYNNMGNACRFTGRYDQAFTYYYLGITAARKNPAGSVRSLLYSNLASLFQQSGQQERGLYYLNRAEKAALEEKNIPMLGGIMINKGVYYAHKEDWDRSGLLLQKALDLGREHRSGNIQYNALNNIAVLYLMRNMPGKALPCLLEAERVGEGISNYYRNGVKLALGETYFQLGNYKQAEKALIEAKNRAVSTHMPDDLREACDLLARIYVASGLYAKAFASLDSSVRIKDSLFSRKTAERISLMEIRYRTAEKDREIFRHQLQIKQQEQQLKEKNLWAVSATAGILVLILLLVSFYRVHLHKQRLQANQYRLLQREQEIERLKAVMNGEEQERTRIARDLHDGIGGMLASIKMHLGAVKKRHPDPSADAGLNEVMNMLQDTATEIRKTSHNLTPEVLLRYNLPEALRIYCENLSIDDILHIDLQFYGNLEQLDKSVELSLYRIVQELIQNIMKHAQAGQAAVRIREHDNIISIMVEDNGMGFEGAPGNGIGLQQIHSRVRALRGYFAVESAKGKGTTAYVEVDLNKIRDA